MCCFKTSSKGSWDSYNGRYVWFTIPYAACNCVSDIKWYASRWHRRLLPHPLIVSIFWISLDFSRGPLEKQRLESVVRYKVYIPMYTHLVNATILATMPSLAPLFADIPEVLSHWETGSDASSPWPGSHQGSESCAWLAGKEAGCSIEGGEETNSCGQDPGWYDFVAHHSTLSVCITKTRSTYLCSSSVPHPQPPCFFIQYITTTYCCISNVHHEFSGLLSVVVRSFLAKCDYHKIVNHRNHAATTIQKGQRHLSGPTLPFWRLLILNQRLLILNQRW